MVLDNDGQGDTSVGSACTSNSWRHIPNFALHRQFLVVPFVLLCLWRQQIADKHGMQLEQRMINIMWLLMSAHPGMQSSPRIPLMLPQIQGPPAQHHTAQSTSVGRTGRIRS